MSIQLNIRIKFNVKKSVYEGFILATLLYGAEHWCLTEKLLNRLRTFHARCIRTVFRVTRQYTRLHHTKNVDL